MRYENCFSLNLHIYVYMKILYILYECQNAVLDWLLSIFMDLQAFVTFIKYTIFPH